MKRVISFVAALAAGILVAANYKNGWWLDKTLVGGCVTAAVYLAINGWAKILWEITKQNDL